MLKIIEVHKLSKIYQLYTGGNWLKREQNQKENFLALDKISFEMETGTKMGIIGPNGAGKSTLLKILARITPPTSGWVKMRGRVASLLEVGTGFNPELTGRENVFLNGMILGMSRREIKKHFDEIVDFAEVGEFIDQPYKYFSSGMSMRLAFAVGAFLDPEILIVDEVLAVGDLAFQKKSLQKMQIASQQEGKTILFVSHNLNAVENLCDRAIYLNGGRIVQMGEAREVVKNYGLAKINEVQSRQSPQGIDLRSHPQKMRKNEGLEKVKIEVGDKPKQRVSVGDKVAMIFTVTCERERRGVALSVSIKNSLGVAVSNFNNEKWGDELVLGAGKNEIKIIINQWEIYGEGKFMVDVSLSYRGEVIEVLNDAFYIEVYPRDVYGSGKMLNPMSNVVVMSGKFEVRK